MIGDLAVLALGFTLCALTHAAWTRFRSNGRRAMLPRDYRRFCTGCRIPHMSKTHLPRELSDDEIMRRAERIHAAMQRARAT